jgi:hypothetical protein
MRRISLCHPELRPHEVKFAWSIDPASALYQRNEFSLFFPHHLDLSKIPPALWWTIFLTSMHAHWLLLRPCRVHVPVRLRPGHKEIWKRLLEAEINTINAYRADGPLAGEIEMDDEGELLPPPSKMPDNGRCATSFSSGKDSLLQAGLLAELTQKPLLITTTSPMQGKTDHTAARRFQCFSQIQSRKNVELIEVRSDYRTILDNEFSARLGYGFAINEICDTFLYTASLIAAGVASGATHLFMASEAEVQENAEINGVTIQHKHFMYSTATQRAIDALLAEHGISYGSLTSPLHNYSQVQTLLWTRYQEISDLQFSCWRLKENEAACSKCSSCFLNALCALAAGGNPQRMGIDLVDLFTAMKDWNPRPPTADNVPLLPTRIQAPKNDRQTLWFIQQVPMRRVMHLLAGRRPARPFPEKMRVALKSYAQLRKRMMALPRAQSTGYRPGFLKQVDPLLREKVAAIYAGHFQPEPEEDYSGILNRSESLADWICEPQP